MFVSDERNNDPGTDPGISDGSLVSPEKGTNNGEGRSETSNQNSGDSREIQKENPNSSIKTSQPIVTEQQKEDAVKEYIITAIQEDIVAYNGYELKRKYPKAMAAMKLYMEDKAQAPLEEDVFMGVLLYSPRTVFFGYFDHKKLFVNILGYDNKWYYTLERIAQSTKDYPNRVECEIEAFTFAFAQLEKQLNSKP